MPMILIVDDSLVQQRISGLMLKRRGYSVSTASNGQEALRQLADGEYDLVLADLNMPEMDGLALLRHIRADDRWKNLPVVMLTGSGIEQDRFSAQEHGVDIFLTKPIDSRELVDTIGNLLG